MRRAWILVGVVVMVVALGVPPLGGSVVPVTRAATATAPCAESGPASAISAPTATWTVAATGPKLLWQRAAFAPTVCRLVAFGGNDPFKGMYNDTWLFDPGSGAWTKIAGTRTSPAKRDFGELAWDATGQRVILFGGRTPGSGRPGSGILQDTWSFDVARRMWTPLITDCRRNVCPPARWGGRLVWSSAIGKLLLFGGTRDGASQVLNDVWTFDTAWHRIATAGGPSGRFLFGMAEDAATGMLLIYGGATLTSNAMVTVHETWQLDPRTWRWSLLPTAATPIAEAEVGMAWLPSLGAVVVTGGSADNGTGIANSTWVFDRSVPTWVQVGTNQPVPSMHLNATLTTDPCHGVAVFLGQPDQEMPATHTDYTWILK